MPKSMQGAWSVLCAARAHRPVFVLDSKSGKLMLRESKTHLETLAPFLRAEYREHLPRTSS